MKPVFIICGNTSEVTMSSEEFKQCIDEAYSAGFEDGKNYYLTDLDDIADDIFKDIESELA